MYALCSADLDRLGRRLEQLAVRVSLFAKLEWIHARWLDWIGQAVSISEEKVTNSNRPSITDYDGQGQHLFIIKAKSHHCPCPQASYISKFHKIMRLMAVKDESPHRTFLLARTVASSATTPLKLAILLARYVCVWTN
jgi:hypothetical protein